MIEWRKIRDHDGVTEYTAEMFGIDFHIWHCTTPRNQFGLTVYRRDANGRNAQLHNGIGIAWYGTLHRCKEQAEIILTRETPDVCKV